MPPYDGESDMPLLPDAGAEVQALHSQEEAGTVTAPASWYRLRSGVS